MPDTYEMHTTCFDGVTTHAVYKVNGNIVKRAKAICSPRDTFDFQIGAQEATDRIFTEDKLFGWDAFKAGKIAVHCDTEAKANAFLREYDKNGLTWGTENKPQSHSNWEHYVSDTCYSSMFGRLGFDRKSFYEEKGLTIIDYPFSQPEAEPKYYSGKVVCVSIARFSGFWTVGKVYEFKDGYAITDNGIKSPMDNVPVKKFDDLEKMYSSDLKFIEFKGEA